MGIEELSMGMSQAKLMTDVSTGVLAMTLDHIEEMGDGMVEMLEESMEPASVPGLGGNFDLTI